MIRRYGNLRGGHDGNERSRGRSTPKTIDKKKTAEHYLFYVQFSKQASDYEITAKLVVNHIKNKFDRRCIANAVQSRHRGMEFNAQY